MTLNNCFLTKLNNNLLTTRNLIYATFIIFIIERLPPIYLVKYQTKNILYEPSGQLRRRPTCCDVEF